MFYLNFFPIFSLLALTHSEHLTWSNPKTTGKKFLRVVLLCLIPLRILCPIVPIGQEKLKPVLAFQHLNNFVGPGRRYNHKGGYPWPFFHWVGPWKSFPGPEQNQPVLMFYNLNICLVHLRRPCKIDPIVHKRDSTRIVISKFDPFFGIRGSYGHKGVTLAIFFHWSYPWKVSLWDRKKVFKQDWYFDIRTIVLDQGEDTAKRGGTPCIFFT